MLNISISSDKPSLFHDTAELIARKLDEAVAARGRAAISLSGGSTPKGLYELLAMPEWQARIPWEKVQVFWGDERFVLPMDKDSNFRLANETLLSKLKIPAGNIHRPMTESGKPEQVAHAYEQTIREVFGTKPGEVPRFDVHLLGLGENGHTASLFPHTKMLHERQRLFVSEFIDEVGMYRLSMTVPILNAARCDIFLVAGEAKAEVVHEVIEGPRRPEDLPAQLIQPTQGELVWMLDKAAAGKLAQTVP